MKYRVVDCPFNRANYNSLIGKVLDSPPAYAVVEEIDPKKVDAQRRREEQRELRACWSN